MDLPMIAMAASNMAEYRKMYMRQKIDNSIPDPLPVRIKTQYCTVVGKPL